MRMMLRALVLGAAMAATAGAQQMDHTKHMMTHGDSSHAMKTPCPLHVDNLALSPAQQLVVDSIRAEHQATMKAMMEKHHAMAQSHDMMNHATMQSDAEHAAMEQGMQTSVAAVRSILSTQQRAVFDAAVTAHATEMKEMQAQGDHDCMACCMACVEGQHAMHEMKKPEL